MIGRYALHEPIAQGGMATVHYGRLLGPVGFSRTVAIKRLHAQYANDPDFVSMFLDEARLAARIRHPNVVTTLDVVQIQRELFVVMEYIAGESVASLAKRVNSLRDALPPRILSSVASGALHGLHAAHEAKDERGAPLGIVHRDISPQNLMVGTDGVTRVLDFGVAKAAGRVQTTREGQLKGKLAYMAPEQMRGELVTRTCDVYAMGVVLWELIVGQRLFDGDNEAVVMHRVMQGRIERPSEALKGKGAHQRAEQFARLDGCVLRALSRDPQQRYATAREMAREVESLLTPATASEVGEWVEEIASDVLAQRAQIVADVEQYGSNPHFAVPHEHGSAPHLAALGAAEMSSNSPPQMAYGTPELPRPEITRSETVLAAAVIARRRQHTIRVGTAIGIAVVLLGAYLGLRRGHSTAALPNADYEPQALATEPTSDPTPKLAPLPSHVVAVPSASPSASASTPPSASAAQAPAPKPKPTAAPTPKPAATPVPKPKPSNCDLESYTRPDGTTGYRMPAGCR